jgi:hypothetical protein
MPDLEIPCGDKGYAITFTCKDSAGAARNLSTFTGAKFKMWKSSSPATLLINASASITSPTTGVVSYTLQATDTAFASGSYVGEIELTASGVIDSSGKISIHLSESG